jgi:hypothetical protein
MTRFSKIARWLVKGVPERLKLVEVDIPGLGKRVKVPGVLYRYDLDKCMCPVCGGLGAPWHGYFSCEECPAVALVESGEVFLPEKG